LSSPKVGPPLCSSSSGTPASFVSVLEISAGTPARDNASTKPISIKTPSRPARSSSTVAAGVAFQDWTNLRVSIGPFSPSSVPPLQRALRFSKPFFPAIFKVVPREGTLTRPLKPVPVRHGEVKCGLAGRALGTIALSARSRLSRFRRFPNRLRRPLSGFFSSSGRAHLKAAAAVPKALLKLPSPR